MSNHRQHYGSQGASGDPLEEKKNNFGGSAEEDEFDFIFDDFDEDDAEETLSDDEEMTSDDDADSDVTEDDEDEYYDDDEAEEDIEDDDAYDDYDDEAEDVYEDDDADEAYDEDEYEEDEDEDDSDSDAYDDEDDFETYDEEEFAEDDGFASEESPKKPSLLSKILSPFKKLFGSLNADPELPDEDDEDWDDDEKPAVRRAAKQSAADDDDFDDEEEAFDDADDFADEDEDYDDSDEYDDDEFDDADSYEEEDSDVADDYDDADDFDEAEDTDEAEPVSVDDAEETEDSDDAAEFAEDDSFEDVELAEEAEVIDEAEEIEDAEDVEAVDLPEDTDELIDVEDAEAADEEDIADAEEEKDLFAAEDDEPEETDASETARSVAEAIDEKRRKQNTQVWNRPSEIEKRKPARPSFFAADDFDSSDEPVYEEPDDFEAEDDFFAKHRKPVDEPDDFFDDEEEDSAFRRKRPARKPFVRKPRAVADDADDFFDDDFDDSESEKVYDVAEEDELAEGGMFGGKWDYGKIALVLTFVILGIFAIDFIRRTVSEWHKDNNALTASSSEASQAPVVTGQSAVYVETNTTATEYVPVATYTMTTVIFTSPVPNTGADNVGGDVETRETEVKTIANAAVHSGSAILVDGEHPLVQNPAMISIGESGYKNVRVMAMTLQINKEMAADMVRWFNDFHAATGLSNLLVYSTTQQPAAAITAITPYGVAIPERATGLTLDLAILNENKGSSPYTQSGNYAWLAEHAAEYGFIVRYPDDKEEETGLEGKSWHFRYVGIPHAAYMSENSLTLEEYLEKIAAHTWEKIHLTATVKGVEYEMYYVPASQVTDSTDVQYPVGVEPVISGDNIGGFLVSCVKQ